MFLYKYFTRLSKTIEAQCEIISEEITTTIPKKIDLITTALSNNSKKRLPSTTSTTEVLRSALRTRHTKNARQNSTDLSDEEELILEAEDQNIQPNNTPKEATQPPLGQILSTQ